LIQSPTDGVFYQSRHGADLFNWALFEPFALKDFSSSEIEKDDSSFQEALRRFNLTLNDRL
jgi:hypothetical protein